MEVALVSAVTGALKPVLAKLGALAGDEYKRFKGVRGDIESLTRELAAMEAFLLKMSEEEDPDVQDKVWMNEVRELSYDMEDSIDDFMQSVDNGDTKPDGFLEKLKSSLGKLGKMKARRRIGNEIADLKKQTIEVAERNARYKAREAFSKAKNTTVDPRALAIFKHASELVGIDKPKAEVVKLLTEGAATQENMKLVSIVGSGGMGKTTLANQVYQDLKGNFKCQAFLSVSRNPDMMSILRTILSEVSGQHYANTESGSIQQIISKIADFLADKRYFVVVDDIWDVDTWHEKPAKKMRNRVATIRHKEAEEERADAVQARRRRSVCTPICSRAAQPIADQQSREVQIDPICSRAAQPIADQQSSCRIKRNNKKQTSREDLGFSFKWQKGCQLELQGVLSSPNPCQLELRLLLMG
ncbi:hypothetical protein ZWY2020_023732 [Hordeum vulgare]|nr:hypothetical protein ZWY2020_023732 [Hordeum vulgare]